MRCRKLLAVSVFLTACDAGGLLVVEHRDAGSCDQDAGEGGCGGAAGCDGPEDCSPEADPCFTGACQFGACLVKPACL